MGVLKQTIMSVCAAFFGVQSEKNRQRDFQEGNFIHFAVVGAVMVLLFILGLLAIVNWVLG